MCCARPYGNDWSRSSETLPYAQVVQGESTYLPTKVFDFGQSGRKELPTCNGHLWMLSDGWMELTPCCANMSTFCHPFWDGTDIGFCADLETGRSIYKANKRTSR